MTLTFASPFNAAPRTLRLTSSSHPRTPPLPRCAAVPPTQPPPTAAPLRTPVHWRIPVLGFIFDVLRRNIDNVGLARRYGPVYKTDVMGVPITVITDIDAVKACYKDGETFRSAGGYPPAFAKIFGENAVFLSDGKKHIEKRSEMQPAFSPLLFPLYFDLIRDESLDVWERVAQQVRDKGTVKLSPLFRDHHLRVIVKLTTGDSYLTGSSAGGEDKLSELFEQYFTLSKGILYPRVTPAWRAALRATEAMTRTLKGLICERLVRRAETIDELRATGMEQVVDVARKKLRAGTLDMLTMLCATSTLETGDGVTHDQNVLKELAEAVLTLWNAGHSTQSSWTLSCIMEAAADGAVWAQLREEQEAAVLMAGGEKAVTLKQVGAEMPVLDSFVSEVLRLYPPATVAFRRVERSTMVCGHQVKEGSVVALDLVSSQRDRNLYEEADSLRIKRFLGGQVPAPPAIMSFGAIGGAHFCLGAALARVVVKAAMATLLREFELELEPKQDRGYCSLPETAPASGVIVMRCERRGAKIVATA